MGALAPNRKAALRNDEKSGERSLAPLPEPYVGGGSGGRPNLGPFLLRKLGQLIAAPLPVRLPAFTR
jgi:hypothetical protein